MKRLLILASIGVLAAIAVLKGNPKNGAEDVVGPEDKNFGAFPPDIPESQFDDLFV